MYILYIYIICVILIWMFNIYRVLFLASKKVLINKIIPIQILTYQNKNFPSKISNSHSPTGKGIPTCYLLLFEKPCKKLCSPILKTVFIHIHTYTHMHTCI